MQIRLTFIKWLIYYPELELVIKNMFYNIFPTFNLAEVLRGVNNVNRDAACLG